MNRSKRRGALPRWPIAGACLLFATAVAHADYVVPAGASSGLAGGSMDLACTDVIVDGAFDLQGGTLTNVRHVQIGAAGSLTLSSGSISLAGNWSNGGTLNAGTGTVSIVDNAACAASSVVSGNNSFYALGITSTTGKLVQFAAGSVQTVQSTLTLTGAAGTPLRVESTTPGSVSADINLPTGGTQNLANLAVRGMSASGQWLAAGQTNQGAGPVSRWFGSPTPPGPGGVAPIPTTSQWTLLLMSLALAGLAAATRRNKS
ncbi:MAG: IPTL-CTERM sorting domain-containing protein [Burkholderiales bacterium]|uniref:IPTL-CTERM sorting domain-containing protein n=1 Tax=Ottowia pentelensis TaxID=511108 RepID=A0ABV6PMJ6_9BURK|nr:IPTL-CTERM sorting domain-containing protein [Ottowia sp.]MBN9405595.1 IPTL-CTERM sorting domain-containing protein [Burkholderiales bacterium]MBS0412878.1 IPTL-CTERM sorting domain-containing protein [Pseudomonadota bacterium]